MTRPGSSSVLLSLVLGLLLGTGCTQKAQPPPPEQLDKKGLAEDSQYMARRYAQWMRTPLHGQRLPTGPNEQMPLELTDERQYRFVLRRLQAAGLTKHNAPYLFQRLARLHAGPEPEPERPLGMPSDAWLSGVLPTGEGTQQEPSRRWCGHMIPLGTAGVEERLTRFEGTALASCYNGADFGMVDLAAFATTPERSAFELLAAESHQDYAGKVLETPLVAVSLERRPDALLVVDSLFLAFDEETGQQHISYAAVEATSIIGHGKIQVEHPRDLVDPYGDEPDTIRICLERGSINGVPDCDYGAVRDNGDGSFTPFLSTGTTGIAGIDVDATLAGGGTPTWTADPGAYFEPPPPETFDPRDFQVPARGRFAPNMPEECTLESQPLSKVVAILTETGGWCLPGSDEGTTVGKGELPWTPPTQPGEYPFNGLINFGIENCLHEGQGIRLQLWVYAQGRCKDPFGGDDIEFLCPGKQEIGRLDYKRICLAEGTQVLKADGTPMPVEEVKVGDQLLSNATGRALTVTTLSRGGEGKPLVKLRDGAGGEVMMTETHPVVTARRGVVQAGEVVPGDALLTRDGPRELVAVERVPYDGMVYNVALGTPEELEAAGGPEARTLYANGFLVGDSVMQSELEKARRTDAREVLARLHEHWHRDFHLQRAAKKSARR